MILEVCVMLRVLAVLIAVVGVMKGVRVICVVAGNHLPSLATQLELGNVIVEVEVET
jgi:hypothetical protein